MEGRQRSPSYPSTPLGEAIEIVRKLHLTERTNSVERDVAAKAMGYTGLSGRSATILSNLIQYGLLEKTGKNQVRVSRRAIDILFPDNESSRTVAMRDAALEPELFQRIRERYPDGIPSEAALEAFLIRQGFTHVAILPATKAFRETFLYMEDMIGSESYPQDRAAVVESQPNQLVERNTPMAHFQQASIMPVGTPGLPTSGEGPAVHFEQRKIWLGGVIATRAQAEELIATINALKTMLKEDAAAPPVQAVIAAVGEA